MEKEKRLPSNLKLSNPDCMFTNPCFETYRLQKKYYIRWVLSESLNDYKCFQCGVSVWGPEQKLLSLELNHKDGNEQNSLISNLISFVQIVIEFIQQIYSFFYNIASF